jgi:hypothetical protein
LCDVDVDVNATRWGLGLRWEGGLKRMFRGVEPVKWRWKSKVRDYSGGWFRDLMAYGFCSDSVF